MPDALVIEGQNLAKTAIRIPQDLPPGPCILLFAFAPNHQAEAQSWVGVLTDLVTSGTADAKQLIVLPTFAKLGAGIVYDQLTKTVPPEAHAATIVAFADPGAIAKAAGAPDTSHVVLSLLDGARALAWTTTGAYSADKESTLRSKIAALA